MKTAKFAGWVAAEVSCPVCGGDCEGRVSGSLMLDATDVSGDVPQVICVDCGEIVKIPKKVVEALRR